MELSLLDEGRPCRGLFPPGDRRTRLAGARCGPSRDPTGLPEARPSPRRLPGVLSQRQERILSKVVQGYLEAGSPLGSKAIAADDALGVGPSTVRNGLAILEEQGLLTHPHTSAGRLPTDAGYRYFVDR